MAEHTDAAGATHTIVTSDGEEFDIPVEGSLGLLALGDVGVFAWREKIAAVKRDMAARTEAAQHVRKVTLTDSRGGDATRDA